MIQYQTTLFFSHGIKANDVTGRCCTFMCRASYDLIDYLLFFFLWFNYLHSGIFLETSQGRATWHFGMSMLTATNYYMHIWPLVKWGHESKRFFLGQSSILRRWSTEAAGVLMSNYTDNYAYVLKSRSYLVDQSTICKGFWFPTFKRSLPVRV